MPNPFEIVSSSGLGLTHGSHSQLSLLPVRSPGAAKTQITINAATGNTIVRDTEFSIKDDGFTLQVGMIWNSKASKVWQFAATSKITVNNSLSMFQNISKVFYAETIELTEPDGRVVCYTKDSSRGQFVCNEPDGNGTSFITVENDKSYTRFFPANGIQEKYDSQGFLLSKILPNGKMIKYQYNANGEVCIILPSNRIVKLTPEEKAPNTRHLTLNTPNQDPVELAVFNTSDPGSLETVITQPDKSVFTTSYAYTGADNSSKMEIQSSDKTGSCLSFDKAGSITALKEASAEVDSGRNWKFDFKKDNNTLNITDAINARTVVTTDPQNCISSIQLPTDDQPKQFNFTNNQLTKMVDSDSTQSSPIERTNQYEPKTGLINRQQDSLGRIKVVRYNTDHTSILFGIKLAETFTQPDEKTNKIKETKEAAPRLFIYNNKRQRVYEITPARRVIRYIYDATTQRLQDKIQVAQFYEYDKNFNLQDISTYPTEITLNAWWQQLQPVDLRQAVITHCGYDTYGRVSQETKYSQLDEKCQPKKTVDTSYSNKSIDPIGRVTRTDIAKVYDSDEQKMQLFSTEVAYDGLSRVLQFNEAVQQQGAIRKTQYEYKDAQTTVIYPNKLNEVTSHDVGGLTSRIARTDTTTGISRNKNYQRDFQGNVKKVTREDNQLEYHWFDDSGRLSFKVLPDGRLIEYQYDARDKIVCQKEYDFQITNLDTQTIESIKKIIANNPAALTKYQFLDSEQQLRFEVRVKKVRIEEKAEEKRSKQVKPAQAKLTEVIEGFVTEYKYFQGNKIASVEYSVPITEVDNLTLKKLSDPDFITVNSGKDKETHYFYDEDDLLVGEQTLVDLDSNKQPIGFVKEYVRDGLGNIIRELAYLNKSPMANSLDEARPTRTDALATWHWYDNAKRRIATLDSDNYLKAYAYYANGKIKTEITYKNKQTIDVSSRAIVLPQLTLVDTTVQYFYDDLGRENKVINSKTQLQIDTEYDLKDNITKRTLTDLKTGKTRIIQKQYDAFNILVKEATERMNVSNGKIKESKHNHEEKYSWIVHDNASSTGLCLRTIDALGAITVFYYDCNRRIDTEVRANGVVIRYRYDIVTGKKIQQYQFDEHLDDDTLAALQKNLDRTGFIDDSLKLPDKSPEKDRITIYSYDSEGVLSAQIDPNGRRHDFIIDAFNVVTVALHQVDQDKTLRLENNYDLRGNCTKTVQDPQGLNITTIKKFDDVLNRQTLNQNELGQATTIQYQGLRAQIQTEEKDRNKTLTQDVHFRLLTETDWSNASTTKHEYDDSTRTHTITSPEGRVKSDVSSAFGQVELLQQNTRQTKNDFGVDGQLESTTFADGSSISNNFDMMGKLFANIQANKKTTQFQRNIVGQVEQICDDLTGEQRKTTITSNSFGEDQVVVRADDQKTINEFKKAGLTHIITKDVGGLGLVTSEQYNLAGGMVQFNEGDASNTYQENIERDILNRETKRSVRMDEKRPELDLVLKQQSYDVTGHTIEICDGLGNISRKIYDQRGNLRFIIDAEGNISEKRYNVNNKENWQRQYSVKLTQDQLATININSKPSDITKLIQAVNQDGLRQRIYDKDGLLRFEITFLEVGKAKLVEWKYDDKYGECYQKVEYAAPVIYPDDLDCLEDNVPSCDQLSNLINTKDKFLKSPKNRTTDYCRNNKGKVFFRRDGEGYVIEKRRDVNNKVIALIKYATKYTNNDFSTLAPADLRSKLDQTNPLNRANYTIYDQFGNLRFQIDGESFLREFRYNKVDRQVEIFSYSNKLKEKLSKDDLMKICQQLNDDSLNRDPAALCKALSTIVTQIQNPLKDVHQKKDYDTGDRVKANTEDATDKMSYTEFLSPNALGLNQTRTDKCNNVWTNNFDKAKRLQQEISPVVEVTKMSQDQKTGILTPQKIKTQVVTTLEYDAASNQTVTTFGDSQDAKQPLDPRKTQKIYNRNNQVVGTQINNVVVDDGTSNLPKKDARPEITKDKVCTQNVLDSAGREVVIIDEKEITRFKVYDRAGRVRFQIDGDGFVSEFLYEDSFIQPSQIIQHGKNLSKDIRVAYPNGFSLSEMLQLTDQYTTLKDRPVTCTYDHRGLKLSATKAVVITAEFDQKNNISPVKVSPQTTWQFDAFGDVLQENTLLNSRNVYATTRRFYDNNGNEIVTVSPKGYVSIQTFGMRRNLAGQTSYVLLQRIECSKQLDDSIDRSSLSQILAQFYKDGQYQINDKDRIEDFEYDRRLLITRHTTTGTDFFYESVLDRDAKPVLIQGKKTVTEQIQRDGEGRITGYILDSGDQRYLIRDARGDVIYETDFPMATDSSQLDDKGQPIKQYVLTQHLINAHRQPVATIKFINASQIKIDEKGQPQLTLPVPDPVQDQQTYIMMDSRGNAILVQTPTGHQKIATFDELNRLIRSYHWVSGYQLLDKTPTRIWHLHGQRLKFDNRQNIMTQETIDDSTQTQTWKLINAFNECEGEGPSENDMRLKHRFDNAGNRYFTNEDKGIPTVSFSDAVQQETAVFRASDVDLTKYSEDEEKAATDLLGQDYGTSYQQVQRTLVVRDEEGNAIQQQLPWYQSRNQSAPEPYQTSLILGKDPKIGTGQCVTWAMPDEALLVPVFKMRVKGAADWEEFKVATYAPEDKSAASIGGVVVDGRVTDCYEYNLDFYYKDPDSGKPAPSSAFRAEGEIMLDTGSYDKSTNLVWYMRDSRTLILCGKIDEVSGVELSNQEEKLSTRLAGTNNGDGRLVIDLSDQASGTYQCKLIRKFKVLQDNVTLGNHGSYSFNLFQPQVSCTVQKAGPNMNELQISWSNLPAECLTVAGWLYRSVGSPHSWHVVGVDYKTFQNKVTDKIQFQFTPQDQLAAIYWGTIPFLPASAFYVTDQSQNKWYLGRFFGATVSCVGIASQKFIGPIMFGGYGPQYLMYKDSSGKTIDAFQLKDNKGHCATIQFHPFVSGSYRMIYDGSYGFDLGSLQASSLSLDQVDSLPLSEQLQIDTPCTSTNLLVHEINVTDFCVTKCVCREELNPNHPNSVNLNYQWKTNLPRSNLQISHLWFPGKGGGNFQIVCPIPISDLSAVPFVNEQGFDYPVVFQMEFLADQGQSIGVVTSSLIAFDDMIPMYSTTAPNQITPVNSPARYWDRGGDSRISETIVDKTYYPSSHALYLSPLPVSKINTIQFEYMTITVTKKIIWRSLPASLTQKGCAISINNIPPGQYQYRFKALDAKQQPVDLKEVGVQYNSDGWAYGQTVVRKSNQAVFVSKNPQQVLNESLELVKPAVSAEYDRWRNQVKVTNRSGQTTQKDFNIFNIPIKTTSPEVNVTDQNGKTTRQTLVTENRFNANRHKVAEVAPNGGTEVRIVNNQGDTLKKIDDDGSIGNTKVDLLRRTVAVRDSSGVGKDIKYSTQEGLQVAEYKQTDGLSEIKVQNEEGCVVQERDTSQNLWHADFNDKRQQTLSINPVLATQMRTFDPRTGVCTQFCDEDKNMQTWTLGDSGSIDEYVGNVTAHTDFSGQKITYTLNFNKQLTVELGIVDPKDPNIKNRGHIDINQTPPPPKNIRYIRDEAGHEVEIIDDGSQLTTHKVYDQDDFCTSLYFIDKDGHVYQATHTAYDEMHRIARLFDTHMAVYMGYDANSNRRFARAYLYGPDPTKTPLKRESWYDYTMANRVILRDCVLNTTKNPPTIDLATTQGMQLVRDAKDPNKITAQVTQDEKQGVLTTAISYKTNSNVLQNTTTSNQSGQVITSMQRDVRDVEGVTILTQVKDGKTSTDETHTNPAGTITTQIHREDKFTQTRTVNSTGSGRPDTESNVYQVKGGAEKVTDTYKHTPYYAEEVKTESISVTRDPQGSHPEISQGVVQTTEDANGNITTVCGAIPDSFRRFVVNSQNCIVFKESAQGKNYYFYAQKNDGKIVLMAYFGDIPDSKSHKNDNYNPAVVNLDVNHQALSSSYPPAAPSKYVVPNDMNYYAIAEALNYTGYAEQIALANGGSADQVVTAGTTIDIPPLYFEIPETAWNGSIPSMEKIIGSLYPQLPAPTIHLKPKHQHHHTNWLKVFVEAAVGVAIMTFAPELFAEVLGVTLQVAGAAAATGMATAGVVETGLAYGAAGMVANLSAQTIEIGFGDQKAVNYKSLVEGFVSAAVSGGMAQKLNLPSIVPNQNYDTWTLAKAIGSAETVAIAKQTVLVATGLERRFDWKALEATALSVAVDQNLKLESNDMTSKLVNGGLGLVTSEVANDAIKQQPIALNSLGVNLFGNLVGSYVGTQLNAALVEQEQKKFAMRQTGDRVTSSNANNEQRANRYQRWQEEQKSQSTWSQTKGGVYTENLEKIYLQCQANHSYSAEIDKGMMSELFDKYAEEFGNSALDKTIEMVDDASHYYQKIATKIETAAKSVWQKSGMTDWMAAETTGLSSYSSKYTNSIFYQTASLGLKISSYPLMGAKYLILGHDLLQDPLNTMGSAGAAFVMKDSIAATAAKLQTPIRSLISQSFLSQGGARALPAVMVGIAEVGLASSVALAGGAIVSAPIVDQHCFLDQANKMLTNGVVTEEEYVRMFNRPSIY